VTQLLWASVLSPPCYLSKISEDVQEVDMPR
jgi:hypothetical protein